MKHSAPIYQSSEALGFISCEGKFWVPSAQPDSAENDYLDDDVLGDQEHVAAGIDHFSEMEAGTIPGVAVEAIRLLPIVEEIDSVEGEDGASGWFWENENGELIRYQMIEQAQLEAAWQLFQADSAAFQHSLVIAAHPNNRYIVDFQENVQVNVDTQSARGIVRQGQQDVSLQDLFASLSEADRVSGRVVRIISKYDEPSEVCSAKWQEAPVLSNTLTVGHESVSVTVCINSVSHKEVGSAFEFEICIVSASTLEEVSGISADESGLNVLMQDVRLMCGRDSFLKSACQLSTPVPLPASLLSTVAAAVVAAADPARCDAPRQVDDMSEEEQLMLAMALSSESASVACANSDALGAGGSSGLLDADPGARVQASSHSQPQPCSSQAVQEVTNGDEKVSGICCHLKFSVPFEACANFPSASVEVSFCIGNQTAVLGKLEFEPEEHAPAPSEGSASSIILETFRMIGEDGEFIDEEVDLSAMPEFVGGLTFLDHAVVENAVKKILSQELLVRRPHLKSRALSHRPLS